MRTLSRPMFNMGGPIKQGVMHGIREPYKGGGAALVGNPVYPKTGGREHHFAWIPAAGAGLARLAPLAARTFGNIRRGWKAAKYIDPKATGFLGKARSAILPTTRFTKMKVPGAPGFRLGAATAQNPSLAFMGASAVPQTGLLAGKVAAAAPGSIWEGTKRYADLVIPGDQSRWWKDKEPPKDIMKPGGYPEAVVSGKGKLKELTAAQKEKWADAQRGKRLNNLLDIMGYDASKKTAVADALIDASKIVSERGTLDRKNITSELINPIIQATSKRLDKPGQIREAVGLMMAKGEIEKDLYKWKPGTALKNAQDMADTLNISVEEAMKRTSGIPTNVAEDLQQLQILKKGVVLTAPEIEQRVRLYANQNDEELKQVISADQLKKGGLEETDSIEVVQGLLTGDAAKDDGYYQVGKEVIKVTNGVPKKQW
jgi:hypothetical protein